MVGMHLLFKKRLFSFLCTVQPLGTSAWGFCGVSQSQPDQAWTFLAFFFSLKWRKLEKSDGGKLCATLCALGGVQNYKFLRFHDGVEIIFTLFGRKCRILSKMHVASGGATVWC